MDHITLQNLQQQAFKLIQTALDFMGVEQVRLRQFHAFKGLCQIKIEFYDETRIYFHAEEVIRESFCEDVRRDEFTDSGDGWFRATLWLKVDSLREVQ